MNDPGLAPILLPWGEAKKKKKGEKGHMNGKLSSNVRFINQRLP